MDECVYVVVQILNVSQLNNQFGLLFVSVFTLYHIATARYLEHSALGLRYLNHLADGRLTARSREVSEPRNSGLHFSNLSKIWQVSRQ